MQTTRCLRTTLKSAIIEERDFTIKGTVEQIMAKIDFKKFFSEVSKHECS
jgi:hypothetical protein